MREIHGENDGSKGDVGCLCWLGEGGRCIVVGEVVVVAGGSNAMCRGLGGLGVLASWLWLVWLFGERRGLRFGR